MRPLQLHSLETLDALDGPGLRTVVFLQGCRLRCRFCHNPDSWDPHAGTPSDTDAIMARLRRMKPYFRQGGGVTFSGGDPLCQPEPLEELLDRCRDEGIHTAIDTSGAFWSERLQHIAAKASMLLLDIKGTSPETFRQTTGLDAFHHLLQILDYLRQSRQPTWLRMVVAENLNASPDELEALVELLRDVPFQRFDVLPYHQGARDKYAALGLPFDDSLLPPSDTLLQTVRQFISSRLGR